VGVGRGLGAVGVGGAAREVDDQRVAFGHAAFHRLVAGGAFPQPLQRLLHGVVVDHHRLAPQLHVAEVARLERRHDVEAGRERQRLALFDDDVLHVGSVDGLDALRAERLVDALRNQVVGDVVEDLRPEALAHDARRHPAGPEAGQAGRFRVLARDPVDGRLHVGHRDLDRELAPGLVDVYQFCFHRCALKGAGRRASAWQARQGRDRRPSRVVRKGGLEPP
jgi:hypothetical protein